MMFAADKTRYRRTEKHSYLLTRVGKCMRLLRDPDSNFTMLPGYGAFKANSFNLKVYIGVKAPLHFIRVNNITPTSLKKARSS